MITHGKSREVAYCYATNHKTSKTSEDKDKDEDNDNDNDNDDDEDEDKINQPSDHASLFFSHFSSFIFAIETLSLPLSALPLHILSRAIKTTRSTGGLYYP